MRFFKLLLTLIISIFLGFYTNYMVISELVYELFPGDSRLYGIIVIILLIGQIAFFFAAISLFVSKKIDKFTYRLFICLYVMLMLLLLFARPFSGKAINLNLSYLFDFSKENLVQNILNIIFFIPIGYFLRNIKFSISFMISVLGVLAIETIQLVTQRGIFDINDIVLNIIGISIGYSLSRKLDLKLVEKEKERH